MWRDGHHVDPSPTLALRPHRPQALRGNSWPVHVARAFKAMEGLRGSVDDGEGKEEHKKERKVKREKFTDEQTEEIKQYCSEYLQPANQLGARTQHSHR